MHCLFLDLENLKVRLKSKDHSRLPYVESIILASLSCLPLPSFCLFLPCTYIMSLFVDGVKVDN